MMRPRWQDQESVRVHLLENLPDRAPGPADDNREAQHVPIGARQLPRPARFSSDAGRRDKLPQMLEGPPVPRRILPVVERHQAVRTRRRGACHQAGHFSDLAGRDRGGSGERVRAGA